MSDSAVWSIANPEFWLTYRCSLPVQGAIGSDKTPVGILRLILALSVVAGHVDFQQPFFLVNASAAVACFFVISGFYMALVLNEKYESRTEFCVARLWRLYPAYFVFTALYVALWAYDGRHFDPLGALLTLTLVGQDLYGILIYPADLLQHIPIAQAWSMAVELQLYFLAALAFKRPRGIVAVFLVGALLRATLQALGYVESPLGVWLFYNVIVYFGAGGIAYLAYRHIKSWPAVVRTGFATVVVAAILFYCYKNGGFWTLEARGSDWRFYPLYALIALALPFIFSLTEKSAIDRTLGELSYPVYLCHIFVFDLARHLHQGLAFVTMAICVLSVSVHVFIEKPLSRLRRTRRLGRASVSAREPGNGASTRCP